MREHPEQSLDLPYLKALFLSSEKMTIQWYDTISSAFPNVEVIDRYGTAELSNSFTRCSQCNGYHINEDYSFTELLPIDGTENKYEIIGTGFLNSAFPMIRYNMKDVFRLDEIVDSQCNYGSKVYRGEIEGRTSDLIFAEGKLLPGVNFYTLFYNYSDEVAQFQLVQNSENSLNIRLVLKMGITASEGLENRLASSLQQRVGSSMKLEFDYVSSIERDKSSGKVKNIISHISV